MTLGVAIVGFGVAGRQHAAALADASFARVRTVLDNDSGVDTGVLPRSADWAALLANPAVDLVALCMPPGSRGTYAEEAMRAGKAVLLEKPPMPYPAQVERLADLGRGLGRPIGVMLQERLRFDDTLLGWDWGSGATAVLEVSRYRPRAHYRRAGWREEPAVALGGVAAHLGVDYLDLACQLLGEPATVHLAGRREHLPGIESRIAGVIEFSGGAVLSFVITSESTVRTERLEILGTERRVLIQDGVVTTDAGGRVEDSPARSTAELRRAVYHEMAQAVASGEPLPRSGLHTARSVSMVLQAVHDQLAVVKA